MDEQMKRHIATMVALDEMMRKAPKDEKGNVVVGIAGINGFGMFYIFMN